jgi:hypothetical protein
MGLVQAPRGAPARVACQKPMIDAVVGTAQACGGGEAAVDPRG